MIIRDLRHVLGDAQEQKLPIASEILLCLCSQLVSDSDSGLIVSREALWVFTLFCMSNIAPKPATDYDLSKTLSCKDIIMRPWSKTIQYKQRKLLTPVLRLTLHHPLCPRYKPTNGILNCYLPHPPRLLFCIVNDQRIPLAFTSKLRNHLLKQDSRLPTSLVTVFDAARRLTPFVVVRPFNLSVFKETGPRMRCCSTFHSL